MNNNVVNLSQQMCSPLTNLWSLNNLHFSFFFAPLPSFFPLSCPFSLSSSLSPFHSLSSSSRVWQTLGATWEGQFVLSTLRSPFELGETTMTCAMLERTPTITPSLRWWGTGLSETFSRLDKPLSLIQVSSPPKRDHLSQNVGAKAVMFHDLA